MQVVVTDSNTPQALAMIRELGRLGHEVIAIAPEEKKNLPLGLHSMFASQKITFPASLTESAYQEWLLDRLYNLRKSGSAILLPTGARTLRIVAKRKIEFRLACDFLVPDTEAMAVSWDKRLLAKAAEECSIPVPVPVHVPEGEKISVSAKNLEYPLVVKYWGGERLGLPPRRRYTIARNSNELAKRYDNMYDVQSPVLLQKLVNGKSYGAAVLMDKRSRPVRVVIHERIRQLPVTGGPGTYISSIWRADIAEMAVRFLRHLRWQGLAMLEFKADDNGCVLIDCNSRLWNSYPLCAACGGRMADFYVRAAMDEDLPDGLHCGYSQGKSIQYFAEDLRASVLCGPKEVGSCLRTLADKRVKGGVHDREDKRPTRAYIKSIFNRPPPEQW